MSIFITHNSETFFRLGLAKSAFRNDIYDNLPLDIFMPSINFVQRQLLRERRLRPKMYMSHDSYFMFLKSFEKVASSLKKSNKAAPAWHKIVSQTIKSEKFIRLNELTAGSDVLAQLVATQFLKSLLSSRDIDISEADKQFSQALQQQSSQGQQGGQSTAVSQDTIKQILKDFEQATGPVVDNALGEALGAVREYSESQGEAQEAMQLLAGRGGNGFSLEALSVLAFLEKPDEYRKRVRLLASTAKMLRQFTAVIPTSLTHQHTVSMVGGIDGVARMWADKQLSDVLPSELALSQLGPAGRALLAAKLAQRQLMVWQRSATVRPVVFVDKSGSMGGNFPGDNVAKISVATGFALAVYRRLDADVYLFDTEVERVGPNDIVRVLLTIDADGGTNIDAVLEEILRIGKRDYLYLIISDGITEAENNVMKRWVESGLAKRTRLVLIDYYANYRWLEVLRGYGNVFNVKSLADFTTSVKNIMLR
jgi:uncharacterized protein with von Willebrand factor type A (vWA) domain